MDTRQTTTPGTRPSTRRRAMRVALAVVAAFALGITAVLGTARLANAYDLEAPTKVKATQVTKSSMTVSFTPSAGAAQHLVRLYSKGNPTKLVEAKAGATMVAATGLKANTLYYISAYAAEPGANGTQLSERSVETEVSTTTYTTATPDGLTVSKSTPSSFTLAWKALPALGATDQYVVEYALDAAITNKRAEKKAGSATTVTVSGLTDNTSYFARVYVADKDGKRKSGSSVFVLGKTSVTRGSIEGRVSGHTRDLTATAYDATSNELVQQATVDSSGSYDLDLRPGRYRVMITYTGADSYTSPWVAKGKTEGVFVPAEATSYTVTGTKATAADAVKVVAGASFTGLVQDSAGKPVRAVDVTAITNFPGNAAREVEYNTVGNAAGTYQVRGLPKGEHWLRYIYSGDGFANRSVAVRVSGGKVTDYRVSTETAWTKGVPAKVRLDTVPFRTKYKAYVDGTPYAGKTSKVHATAWLAGSYPTTTAKMTYQWNLNGKAITGATGSSYQISSKDKGKRLSVTATATRYGYQTGKTTSTEKTIR